MSESLPRFTRTPSVPQDAARNALYVAAVALILLIGGALRIAQFTANPSLWLDEVAVARNVYDRPLSALLMEPLDYQQTASPGFLLPKRVPRSSLVAPTTR